jgi:hypothetical protein
MATHDRCGLPITVVPFCDHVEDTGYDSGLLPAVCGAVESYPPGQVRWVAESAGGAFDLFDQPVVGLRAAVAKG